jgi:hypothetical protein
VTSLCWWLTSPLYVKDYFKKDLNEESLVEINSSSLHLQFYAYMLCITLCYKIRINIHTEILGEIQNSFPTNIKSDFS